MTSVGGRSCARSGAIVHRRGAFQAIMLLHSEPSAEKIPLLGYDGIALRQDPLAMAKTLAASSLSAFGLLCQGALGHCAPLRSCFCIGHDPVPTS